MYLDPQTTSHPEFNLLNIFYSSYSAFPAWGLRKVRILPFPYGGELFLHIYWFSRGKGFTKSLWDKKNYLKEVYRKYHSGNRKD